MTEFLPAQGTPIDAVPLEFRDNFKPVDPRTPNITGDAAFIPATAIENPDTARVEAYRVENLQESRSILASLATEEISLVDGDDAYMERILSDYPIPTAIDQYFVREAIGFRHENGDPTFLPQQRKEKGFINKLTTDLIELNQDLTAEEASRAKTRVPLSHDRVLYVVTEPDGNNVALRIPLQADISEVERGPGAVIEILGAPLSEDDYIGICDAFDNLPGEGFAALDYQDCKTSTMDELVRLIDSRPILQPEDIAEQLRIITESLQNYGTVATEGLSEIVSCALLTQQLRELSVPMEEIPQPFNYS